MTQQSPTSGTLVGEQAFDWPTDPLAVGGMAVVFRARDRRLPRDVILKHPRTHDFDGQPLDGELKVEFERRLEREALVLAKLQHPSIVTIYEMGRSQRNAPFCVLERVEGRPLTDILEELTEAEQATGKRYTRDRLELLSNLTAVAEALACAHDRNIVHRDVTPNNILIGPRGEATLIDWGLAKDLDDDHSADPTLPALDAAPEGNATIIAGTPPYVSLEQAMGKEAHPSYDVYSFGATLYHVIAGKPPYTDSSPVSYLARLVDGERPPPADPRDPELSGIIERAMATKAEDRFTAHELLRAMKEYLTGDLVFSHRYSRTGRIARWARKHKATAVAITVTVLAAVMAVIGWSWVSERAERSARRVAEARSRAADKVADAEKQAATEARRSAAAERERAEALEEAARKDREAREALAAAEAADKKSQAYQQLRRIAERKRKEADQARDEADNMAAAAEQRAAQARAAAEKAQADAQATRREAAKQVDAMSMERDQAQAARRAAELERDQALADRRRAEEERDRAVADRQRAEQERDLALATRQSAEAERDQALADRQILAAERDRLRQRVQMFEQTCPGGGGPIDAGLE